MPASRGVCSGPDFPPTFSLSWCRRSIVTWPLIWRSVRCLKAPTVLTLIRSVGSPLYLIGESLDVTLTKLCERDCSPTLIVSALAACYSCISYAPFLLTLFSLSCSFFPRPLCMSIVTNLAAYAPGALMTLLGRGIPIASSSSYSWLFIASKLVVLLYR